MTYRSKLKRQIDALICHYAKEYTAVCNIGREEHGNKS